MLIVLLEDDLDLRDMLCELFTYDTGAECLGFGAFEELVPAEDRVLGADVAVLDVNLGAGRPSGLDAYAWLRERRFAGRIAFLTGHARAHPLVKEALELPGVELLEKPVEVSRLQRLIAEG